MVKKYWPVTMVFWLAGAGAILFLVSCARVHGGGAQDEPLFRFVHLTDTHCLVTEAKPAPPPLKAHIVVGGFKFYWKDMPNSLPNLEHTVAYINQTIKPDFVLHTGDISSAGRLSNLQRARKLLDRLDCPYYVLMGDNDLGMKVPSFQKDPGASNFARVFGKHNYSFDRAGRHFVMLSAYPTENDLAWLEQDLEKNSDKLTFLCTHRLVMVDQFTRQMVSAHQPKQRLQVIGVEKIEALLDNYPNVQFVLSGHCHCSLAWQIGKVRAYSTAALVGVPIEFRVFTVYPDRVEVVRYRAATAADVRAGRWHAVTSEPILREAAADKTEVGADK